jgi:N,N'-diacetyllegionaminate synthase
MHCTSEYPAPFRDVNLNAITTMRNYFKMPVGYSDHTSGIEISLAAVALGATIIEKHITIDKSLPGPDHEASIVFDELEMLVKSIRNIDLALGDGIKCVTDSEVSNRIASRKSLYAKKIILKGDIFSEENIAVRRPAMGISPMRWHEIIGRAANKNYAVDEVIIE